MELSLLALAHAATTLKHEVYLCRKTAWEKEEKQVDRNLFFDFKNSTKSNKYLMECARKRGDGFGHGFGLLRDEGVAGVGDYDYGDAIA